MNTENFLCASHPINCSILLQHLHRLGFARSVSKTPLQRFHSIIIGRYSGSDRAKAACDVLATSFVSTGRGFLGIFKAASRPRRPSGSEFHIYGQDALVKLELEGTRMIQRNFLEARIRGGLNLRVARNPLGAAARFKSMNRRQPVNWIGKRCAVREDLCPLLVRRDS